MHHIPKIIAFLFCVSALTAAIPARSAQTQSAVKTTDSAQTTDKHDKGISAKNVDSDLPIYVLNLQTDTRPIDAEVQPVLKNFRPKYAIYTISTSNGQQTLYLLRLGYFHSLKLAKANLKRLRPFYPDAWVDRVTKENKKNAENWFLQHGLGPHQTTLDFRNKETGVPTHTPSTKSAATTVGTATLGTAAVGSTATAGAVTAKKATAAAATSKPATTAPITTTTGAVAPAKTTPAAPVVGATTAGAAAAALAGVAAPATAATEKTVDTAAPIAAPDNESKLMQTAKLAMVNKDYRKASSYLTHILQDPHSKEHQEAQELLGLAWERQGLPAQARAEYEKYLKQYPTGPDADRVRQRLNGLLTAKASPREKLKGTSIAGDPTGSAPGWGFFGSFSQYYRNQQSSSDFTSTQTTDNSLSSDLVMSGRKRGSVWNQRIDFAGNYLYNFLNQSAPQSASGGTTSIYSMFYDLSDKFDDVSMRLGRQTHNSDGVLTRFDGITLNKRIGQHEKLSFLAGFPVDLSYSNSVDTNRKFYATSIKFESLIKNLDSKFYFMHQTNDGMTDREAVGNETQYVNNTTTMYFMYDYDLFYKQTNLATFIGNWRTRDNSSFNITADYRNNPFLTTTNALIGQPVSTLDQLRQTFTLPEIQQLAQDRTGLFRSLALSATKTLSPRYQLNGDITVSSLGGTPASGGVAATPPTGDLYYYNLQLVANNLLTSNDVAILGARYYTDVSNDTVGVNFSDRFSINPRWRMNPRLAIDWRSGDDGSKRITYTPRVIMQWRPSRSWQMEMEIGFQTSTYTASPASPATPSNTQNNFYGYIGYSHDF